MPIGVGMAPGTWPAGCPLDHPATHIGGIDRCVRTPSSLDLSSGPSRPSAFIVTGLEIAACFPKYFACGTYDVWRQGQILHDRILPTGVFCLVGLSGFATFAAPSMS